MVRPVRDIYDHLLSLTGWFSPLSTPAGWFDADLVASASGSLTGAVTAAAAAGQASATGVVSVAVQAVPGRPGGAVVRSSRRRNRPGRVVVPLPPARPLPLTGVVIAMAEPGSARASGSVIDIWAQARSEDEAMLLEAA